MKKRFLLFLLFIIFLISLTTLVLILKYLDPYDYKILALGSIIFSYFLAFSSIVAIFLYFIKKVYFRWNVYVFHVLTSFRQWFFISLFFLSLLYFNYLNAPIFVTWLFTFLILFFLELFIKNQDK